MVFNNWTDDFLKERVGKESGMSKGKMEGWLQRKHKTGSEDYEGVYKKKREISEVY